MVDVVALTDASTADHMTWDVTDLGFRMGLSPEVPHVLARHVRGLVGELLARHGSTMADVDAWAVHPGGPRILDTVAEQLDLPPGAAGRLAGGARRARQLLVGHRAARARRAARGGRPGAGQRPSCWPSGRA